MFFPTMKSNTGFADKQDENNSKNKIRSRWNPDFIIILDEITQ